MRERSWRVRSAEATAAANLRPPHLAGMILGPDALGAPDDVRDDRHIGGLRHPRGPRLELLDLEAAAERGLGIDTHELPRLERLAGRVERLRAARPVDRDVAQAAHDRPGQLAVG